MSFLGKIAHYFNLEPELEGNDRIHEEILKGISFKGTNLWILVFAIVVASVGLNMNSTAVIIGAMLISPLMGPINGMGYSIATYNFELFRTSLRNFGFAVIASLVASTTYFALSPISTAHSELLARTSPSIYDVLIAFFGGLAGIVAICSKQKGNVIPGVAIATALMPPLCTAGYGLASGQMEFFLGALYLFTINTVFIALASVVTSQILKLPIRTIVDASQKKTVNRWITVVIAIVLLPSIYFGYGLVKKERFIENANLYISNVRMYEGNYLLKSDIDANKRTITLVYGGFNLTPEQKTSIIAKAGNFKLDEPEILIEQGLAFDNGDLASTETYVLKERIGALQNAISQKERDLDSISSARSRGKELLKEAKALYPIISSCSYSDAIIFSDSAKKSDTTTIVLIGYKNGYFSNQEQAKVSNWLSLRLKTSKLKVIYEKE
jgi:uncharacterized hydrophobic protein (TIGR00271 family)